MAESVRLIQNISRSIAPFRGYWRRAQEKRQFRPVGSARIPDLVIFLRVCPVVLSVEGSMSPQEVSLANSEVAPATAKEVLCYDSEGASGL